MPATPFGRAFTRTAKLSEHKTSRVVMHWRHKERGWEVVSTTLHNEWDNAEHPRTHDDFHTEHVGTIADDSVPRFKPDNSDNWETFHREVDRMPDIIDHDAHNQLVNAVSDLDYLNAEAVATFLHDSFTAEYSFDGEFNGTGRYETCDKCNGTGTVCGADNCITYCQSDKHDATYVSDPGCSCGSCNYHDHQVTCDQCDGEGELYKESFTREFPQNRAKLLSDYPSTRELQTIQFVLNKLDAADKAPSPRKVLKLFDTLENGETEDLIDTAVSYLEPVLRTVEVEEETSDGDTTTVRKTDPEAIRETKVELRSTIAGISKKQAQAQVTV